jgi:hypothetical protein
MSDREERTNERRKAKGLKPLSEININKVIQTIREDSGPFDNLVKETEDDKKKKKKKKVIKETSEVMNSDTLFETEPLNKEDTKVEEELLNE